MFIALLIKTTMEYKILRQVENRTRKIAIIWIDVEVPALIPSLPTKVIIPPIRRKAKIDISDKISTSEKKMFVNILLTKAAQKR